ncbi:hypothetical protein H4S14_001658 [Agrobacterium vitis]|nr:hypothetical protein [Agrobacterium vitis]MBE1437914.1 hypothetical protein [Agrobacterium vitis]
MGSAIAPSQTLEGAGVEREHNKSARPKRNEDDVGHSRNSCWFQETIYRDVRSGFDCEECVPT